MRNRISGVDRSIFSIFGRVYSVASVLNTSVDSLTNIAKFVETSATLPKNKNKNHASTTKVVFYQSFT